MGKISILGLIFFAAVSAVAQEYKAEKMFVFAVPTLSVATQVKNPIEIQDKLVEMYQKVSSFMASRKIKQIASGFAQFTRYEPGVAIEFEAGFPTQYEEQGEGEIIGGYFPGSTNFETLKDENSVVYAIHRGPYNKVRSAHSAIQDYIKEHKETQIGGAWEFYAPKKGYTFEPGEKPGDHQTNVLVIVKGLPK